MAEDLMGAFPESFARRKRWKIDPGLWSAIDLVLPADARVVDIGAGIGRYVDRLNESGRLCVGCDGIPGIDVLSSGLVVQINLAEPIVWNEAELAQWALCIEVGEHIPPEREAVFLDNLASAATDGLIVSWAVPGQRGRNHINCRSPEWVIDQLRQRDWPVCRKGTVEARAAAGKGWNQKLLVFRR